MQAPLVHDTILDTFMDAVDTQHFWKSRSTGNAKPVVLYLLGKKNPETTQGNKKDLIAKKCNTNLKTTRDDPEPVAAPPEPLHRQRVKVTEGRRSRKRDLLLYKDTLVIAKAKRGSTPRPQLCLALAMLQVFCSGKGAAGDGTMEEKGKDAKSLVLLWPSGSCIVTFCSRVVKELWLSALLGPPAGVEGARVTQVPSIKLLRKELRRRKAAMPLHASSLERLVERQAEQGDSAERLREHSPGTSPPCLFALLSLPSGGTGSRRRFLPWPFGRRGNSATAAAPGSAASGNSGALFGRPLEALCSQDGTLPQPIQDLLALLQQHGPSTEGIFRLAAGEHASRQLREALDSGAEVQLESQPAHLLAVILKPLALQDFLRKMPSKLLRAELYEDWMSALQKESRQEKLAALKEVASKLPKGNLLLLKQLLSLLQNISSNVATSRMNGHNLAICVGPNLLSPPEEHTLPLDVLVEVTQKVTELVEFLLEHRGELFEKEEETVFAGASGEESAALEAKAETGEVPPVDAECKHVQRLSEEKR
ncbi:PREDICTED: T-cell activation Rho GTPase-activating protein-like [Calidris pugnax]|uniref:T-cell activation Rho GTPase-activating protein-like n=1 Tax=Calidris pugnax TaxID=198806 RepID=UPI00071D9259|nr:PREDICTED: T-cell activation Rho GTPase-activating protein-like [Calidris pugnax]